MFESVDIGQGSVVAAGVAVAMGLVKSLELAIGKIRGTSGGGLRSDEKAALFDIKRHCATCERVHNETDRNGIPMIHFPRHYGDEIHKIPGGFQQLQGTLDQHTLLLTDIRDLLKEQR